MRDVNSLPILAYHAHIWLRSPNVEAYLLHIPNSTDSSCTVKRLPCVRGPKVAGSSRLASDGLRGRNELNCVGLDGTVDAVVLVEETVVGRDAAEEKRVELRDIDMEDGVDEAAEADDTVVAPEGVREDALRPQLFA